MRHFKRSDFACPCCGEEKMDDTFLQNVDNLREDLGHPMIIESGYRCPKHNAAVGGAKDSTHVKGIACDPKLSVMPLEVREKLFALLKGKYKDIFKGQGAGKYNLHFDSRSYYARWAYSDAGKALKKAGKASKQILS